MLGHQLPALPPFAQLWNELGAVFTWLEGRGEEVERPAFPVSVAGVDPAWRPPAMVQSWGSSVPLEIIRFAAANRLCVNLVYAGSSRLIEPYSLRRTSDGHLLLHATRHNTGEARSYRVDRIQGAEVATEPFTPRYTIEFSVSAPLSAPPTRRINTGTSS
ncbi:MAG: WYL domain-containing protein [Deltaproteobacteria bacterium]|nr:WYL domain-containing protein [Deltaproteobacteria bacterium]